jgi:hypothetical protein
MQYHELCLDEIGESCLRDFILLGSYSVTSRGFRVDRIRN